jgi:cobalamin biosynthetic protein CobC
MARCIGGIMTLTHGGQLHAASMQYGGSIDEWLDLSTGIAPWSYPLPSVPDEIWQRLPENNDGLETAASSYYQVAENQLLPIAGSQWAIEQIPRLYPAGLKVGMLRYSYSEHALAWQAAGHTVRLFDNFESLLLDAAFLDAAVLINPDNPLGYCVSEQDLCLLKQKLYLGVMVIDLAFIDGNTISHIPLEKDIWLLRSVGKFFGLAGIRLGFVLATEEQIEQLAQKQSPWAVNHLARWAGKIALADTHWQTHQYQKLTEQSQRLKRTLERSQFTVITQTDYFVTITHHNAQLIYQSALNAHILLRHFPAFNGIRFGLPKTEGDWFRLEKWLQETLCLL